jgi:ParB family transcriptional regulator, chromosome partitioning protein
MAENRRGLGRGLSALLGESDAPVEHAAAAEAVAEAGGARDTPIELIHANPDQPRRQFAEAELEELAASIRQKGVIQPLLLRPAPGLPGEFQIVAGERRWRAAQRAGLRALPAVIRDFDDGEVLEIAIVENVQRADLNAIEEALGYKALLDRFGRTQEAVAEVVGKSRSHVANALRLLALPGDVQEHVLEGRLTAGHARAIAASADPSYLARQVIERGLNVRDTEALARKGSDKAPRSSTRSGGSAFKDADTQVLEGDLEALIGMKVQIVDRGGVGEVRINYANLEQLDDLCRRLTRG